MTISLGWRFSWIFLGVTSKLDNFILFLKNNIDISDSCDVEQKNTENK